MPATDNIELDLCFFKNRLLYV